MVVTRNRRDYKGRSRGHSHEAGAEGAGRTEEIQELFNREHDCQEYNLHTTLVADLRAQLRDRTQCLTNGQNSELHASRGSFNMFQPVCGGVEGEIATEGEESPHAHG